VIPGLIVAFVAGLLTMTVVSSRTARFEIRRKACGCEATCTAV
jgi:hypothetical protein